MTEETETVRADHVWMRDGKPWAPPENWQAVYDAVCEYAAKPDHLYTDVERVVATHAFDLTDAVVAALSRAPGAEDRLADEKQEVVAALYKAWPDAEDIPSDFPLGIIGCIELIISERDAALASLKVCRESLTDQASARRDATMPVLVPEVIEAWANEAEASYAMAETAEERRNAHGLSLLVEWQRRATLQQAAEPVTWRPEVRAFADLMEAQLRANDHKRGWKDDTDLDLFERLGEESAELLAALHRNAKRLMWGDDWVMEDTVLRVGREAADVANFALMIADVCGALKLKENGLSREELGGLARSQPGSDAQERSPVPPLSDGGCS